MKRKYPETYRPAHPLADRSGRVKTARMLLYDRIGSTPQPCYQCGVLVDWLNPIGRGWKNVLCIAYLNGNQRDVTEQNLAPACRPCSLNIHRDPNKKSRYYCIRLTDHPLCPPDRREILIPEHRLLLYERLGSGMHPCHWCGKLLDWRIGERKKRGALMTDHVDNDPRNNAPENLVAACQSCNVKRLRANTIRDGEPFVTDNSGWRHRAEQRHCEACRASFLFNLSEKNPRKGRFCSRLCANRTNATK